MPINYNKLYEEQLQEMSDILELINYRPRTVESYLRSISECCEWLGSTYSISIDDATVPQLRAFLAFLHRPASERGDGNSSPGLSISTTVRSRNISVTFCAKTFPTGTCRP